MRFFYITLIIILFQAPSFAQKDSLVLVNKYRKRLFNLGFSTGVGGMSNFFNPTVDLSIKGTMLRGVYGPLVEGAGISQQLFKLSQSARAYWCLSAYYLYSQLNGFYAHKWIEKSQVQVDQYRSLSFLTGVKIYFGKHWYSHLQLGTSHIQYYTYQGVPNPHSTYSLYFEFGMGFNILNSYHKTGQTYVPRSNDDDD